VRIGLKFPAETNEIPHGNDTIPILKFPAETEN